mmetsp:Transcript_2619/g.4029  ORF Transcript_2619/g.4029 Transcript_2619/m.4029 type:complete len:276 (-) Transcript_2619:2031-2858(-)
MGTSEIESSSLKMCSSDFSSAELTAPPQLPLPPEVTTTGSTTVRKSSPFHVVTKAVGVLGPVLQLSAPYATEEVVVASTLSVKDFKRFSTNSLRRGCNGLAAFFAAVSLLSSFSCCWEEPTLLLVKPSFLDRRSASRKFSIATSVLFVRAPSKDFFFSSSSSSAWSSADCIVERDEEDISVGADFDFNFVCPDFDLRFFIDADDFEDDDTDDCVVDGSCDDCMTARSDWSETASEILWFVVDWGANSNSNPLLLLASLSDITSEYGLPADTSLRC